MKNIRSYSGCVLAALAVSVFFTAPTCNATSGTWNGTQNAMWTNSANWSASPYAGYSTSGNTITGAVDYSEKIGAVTLSNTGNVIRTAQAASGRSAVLTLTSLTRSANATLDFQGTGLGVDDRNRIFIGGQTSGLLGFWATYNDTGLAANDAARGVCAAGTASSTEIAAKGPDSIIPDDATADVRITTAGDSGPITLAGATENRVALLQQCTDTAATVDTASKTLRAYGLLINTNQQSLTIGQNAGDGKHRRAGGPVQDPAHDNAGRQCRQHDHLAQRNSVRTV